MDEELGLLDAIAEQPDADHNRSIYADWLEDHAEAPRAEFVRLQLALARLSEDHPDRASLMTRERGLLYRHERRWTLGLDRLAERWTFRRGFVEEVVVARPLTAAQYDELFAWRFVRRVRAERYAWRLFPGLVESEGARRLEGLHIADTPLEATHFRDLFECPRFERLSCLTLARCNAGLRAVRQLVKSPLLERLSSLALRGSVGTAAAALLVRSPRLKHLRRLEMSTCDLDADAALALASAPSLAGLTALNLDTNHLGIEGVIALIRCPHLRGLNELDLSLTQYTGESEGWSELYGPAGPPGLTALVLRENSLYRSQVFDLISSPRLATLRFLDLSRCHMYDDGSSWAGPDEFPATPLHLRLARTSGVSRAALVEMLEGVLALRRVERLDLDGLLDEDALALLLSSPHLGQLRRLGLGGTTAVDDLIPTLCSSRLSRQLTGLDLSECHLTDGDAVEIARTFPHLTNLTWLSLRRNHIGPRGARALAESPYLRNLRHLDLSHNDVDDDGAFALARAEHLASPVVLDVSGNDISPAGMAALLGAAERAFERGVTIPAIDA